MVRRCLAPCLVSTSHVQRLASIAGTLPATAIHALEIRLAPDSTRVDLSVGLQDRATPRFPALASFPPHIRRLFERWSAEDPDLGAVEALWLEFDLVSDTDGIPSPLVCAKLSPTVAPDWLTITLFPSLTGQDLTDDQSNLVRRCLRELPRGGRLLYAFSLNPRSPSGIRLEFFGVAPPAMAAYLQRVSGGDHSRQLDAATHLLTGCDRYHLSFDIENEISPRIGIEGGFVGLPHREPGWRRLFDGLVRAGLCQAEKRDAVLDWPGYDTRLSLRDAWPSSAEKNGYCVRSLSHIKLLTWPDRAPEAKAYLLFQYLPQRPGGRSVPAALT